MATQKRFVAKNGLDNNGLSIINVADPTNAQDVATKAFVLASASASGVSSVNTRTGAVTLTSADVGLGNVDNSSDANKPVSTATQTALDLKASSASPTLSNPTYTGTLTGGTGVVAIGTNQIYKDATGNVGIGTANPAQKLSVVGVIESTTGGVKFPDGTTQTSALSDNTYTVTGITGTAATITVDFSLVYSNAIIITLPSGTTSATINFININSKATSGMLFAFSIILSHVTALTATTSVVWRFGAAATSGSLPKWTGNIVPPSTVAANAIDIWSFFSYDVGTSLVGSLSMADIRNA